VRSYEALAISSQAKAFNTEFAAGCIEDTAPSLTVKRALRSRRRFKTKALELRGVDKK
jgi:hypothetical protein